LRPATEEYLVRAWGLDDGLRPSALKSALQTPDGYLWLAGFGGLARFDGDRFATFDTNIRQPCGTPGR
jgi:ligand-binding sensor domain-containing protein